MRDFPVRRSSKEARQSLACGTHMDQSHCSQAWRMCLLMTLDTDDEPSFEGRGRATAPVARSKDAMAVVVNFIVLVFLEDKDDPGKC